MDKFTRDWITNNAVDIVRRYEEGVLTLRALHYQLVSIGMTNTTRHYKRVVAAMGVARREGLISYNAFSDHDREMLGETEYEEVTLDEKVEEAKKQVGLWMNNYYLNRWSNQAYFPEVFIEKKALQGVFLKTCKKWDVALGACKGYPSLTFLNDAADRFIEAQESGKRVVIIYFGDYDPSGEDIPRVIKENLRNDFGVYVEVKRVALTEDQVIEMRLPPAPAKPTDSRTANWDGLGQVELDAVPPETLQEMCDDAIKEIFDFDKHGDLLDRQETEEEQFRAELKSYVQNL